MIDERIDLPESDTCREWLKQLLDYPLGADRILSVGRRYPTEIQTLRHHRFPFVVIFDGAICREARKAAADGARVQLTIEATHDGRTEYVTKLERV